MKTPIDYLNLAAHVEAAAERNFSKQERATLQKLAQAYLMRATALPSSAKVPGRLRSGRRTKKVPVSPLPSKRANRMARLRQA